MFEWCQGCSSLRRGGRREECWQSREAVGTGGCPSTLPRRGRIEAEVFSLGENAVSVHPRCPGVAELKPFGKVPPRSILPSPSTLPRRGRIEAQTCRTTPRRGTCPSTLPRRGRIEDPPPVALA